ncbi:putative transcriptional regulatory protein [Micractinium conductrix]|uniref:Transcriptional regulatory protein n=1 Tax=Micractinium conductrix TaxID=554055 RepID=A0A2P6VA25_9CHLO|nr:putative transcriptional regulatory protein [Micractinium conductrix]|eukprot:PSC70937.1 putative transcriptional regulatory protein [Micractinium conductrix]
MLRTLATAATTMRATAFVGNTAKLLRNGQRAVAPQQRPLTCTPFCMGRRSAKIAVRKGKADAQKSKLYGKIGKQIAQAVRQGGPDALANSRLKDALAAAKAAQVPVDIIDRNIKRASESKADYAEITYEAYGVGGTGFVIECLTDNVNRSASDVKAAITKGGGKVADPGSVLFNFQRQGLVMVDVSEGEDAVFEAAMEAGAADFQPATDDDGTVTGFKVLTAVEDYGSVSSALAAAGLKIAPESSGLVYTPLVQQEVDDDAFEGNEALLERLLAVDDVDAVYTTVAGLE